MTAALVVVAAGVAVAVVASSDSSNATREVAFSGRKRSSRTSTTTSTTVAPTTTTAEPVVAPPEPEPEARAPEPAPVDPAPPSDGIRWRTYTYSVVTDGPVAGSVDSLRSAARSVWGDERGWRAAGIELVEVPDGGNFVLVLANHAEVPKYSPGTCDEMYSCQSGPYVVINDDRWAGGSPNWPGPLDQYRTMVLNHEVGHWLGRGHQGCGGGGQLAAVMQQQSIGLDGCAINPWPLPWEIDSLR